MLNNQIKQNIFSSFIILAIFIFGIITIPAKASADRSGYVTPYGSTRFNDNIANNNQYYNSTYYQDYNSTYYQEPVYVPAPTPIVYLNTTDSNTKVTTTETASANTDKATEKSSNLLANAVFGSNSLMPSGLIQWVFFAILILLVVILFRKIYGGSEKYYAAPMKYD